MYGYPYLHKPVQTNIRTEKTTHEKARIHYFANKILNSADMQILLNPKYENLRPFVTLHYPTFVSGNTAAKYCTTDATA